MWLGFLALLIGLLLGLWLPGLAILPANLQQQLPNYLGLALLAAIDATLGAWRANMEGTYDTGLHWRFNWCKLGFGSSCCLWDPHIQQLGGNSPHSAATVAAADDTGGVRNCVSLKCPNRCRVGCGDNKSLHAYRKGFARRLGCAQFRDCPFAWCPESHDR
jgi:hypothetical protein